MMLCIRTLKFTNGMSSLPPNIQRRSEIIRDSHGSSVYGRKCDAESFSEMANVESSVAMVATSVFR
jgi:hypothetical protein